MSKRNLPSYIQFADLSAVADKFSFVDDETLRANIALKMQFITFLLSLESEFSLGTIKFMTFKTIIIYTASIIEALIHYKLRYLITEEKIDDTKLFKESKKYTEIKPIVKLDEEKTACGAIETTTRGKLEKDTAFQHLNRAANKCKMFNNTLYNKAEHIRKSRNRLHLNCLTEIDAKYEKKDIEKIFSYAKDIIASIKKD